MSRFEMPVKSQPASFTKRRERNGRRTRADKQLRLASARAARTFEARKKVHNSRRFVATFFTSKTKIGTFGSPLKSF